MNAIVPAYEKSGIYQEQIRCIDGNNHYYSNIVTITVTGGSTPPTSGPNNSGGEIIKIKAEPSKIEVGGKFKIIYEGGKPPKGVTCGL
jgi:hypothetical protein